MQEPAAHLRQAHDLLPAIHADAGGHTGHPDYLDAAGHAPFRTCSAMAARLGINFHYAVQPRPEGLAQAFHRWPSNSSAPPLARWFWATTFSYGHDLAKTAQEAGQQTAGARVFAYPVQDPERYGVVEFDASGKALSVEEKPGAEIPLRGYGTLFLRQPGSRHRPGGETLCARRTGDHRRQSGVSTAQTTGRGGAGPRYGVARYGHASGDVGGRALHPDDRNPARSDDRLS